MLVLSRHKDEQIIIGDDIVITVVDLRGDKVRIGIEAPTETTVHRREVYEAIRREAEQAKRLEPPPEPPAAPAPLARPPRGPKPPRTLPPRAMRGGPR